MEHSMGDYFENLWEADFFFFLPKSSFNEKNLFSFKILLSLLVTLNGIWGPFGLSLLETLSNVNFKTGDLWKLLCGEIPTPICYLPWDSKRLGGGAVARRGREGAPSRALTLPVTGEPQQPTVFSREAETEPRSCHS